MIRTDFSHLTPVCYVFSVLTCESFRFFDSAEPSVREVVLVVCERN